MLPLGASGRLFINLVDTTVKALPKIRTTALTQIAAAILGAGAPTPWLPHLPTVSEGVALISTEGGAEDTASPWLSGRSLTSLLWSTTASDSTGLGRILRYSSGRAATARRCLEKLQASKTWKISRLEILYQHLTFSVPQALVVAFKCLMRF